MKMVCDVVKILEGLAVEDALIILDNAKNVVASVSGLAVAFECNREMFKTNYPEQVLTVSGDYDKEGLAAFKQQILGEAGGVGNNWRLPVIPVGDMENFKIESVKLRESPKGMLFDAMVKLATEQQSADYIEVPIRKSYEKDSEPIGSARIRKDSIPDNPDWCLTLVGSVTNRVKGKVTEYRLDGFAVQSDDAYLGYLKNRDAAEPANTVAPIAGNHRMTETSIALGPLFKQVGKICEDNGLEFCGFIGGPMPSPLCSFYSGEGKYLIRPDELTKLTGTLLVGFQNGCLHPEPSQPATDDVYQVEMVHLIDPKIC